MHARAVQRLGGRGVCEVVWDGPFLFGLDRKPRGPEDYRPNRISAVPIKHHPPADAQHQRHSATAHPRPKARRRGFSAPSHRLSHQVHLPCHARSHASVRRGNAEPHSLHDSPHRRGTAHRIWNAAWGVVEPTHLPARQPGHDPQKHPRLRWRFGARVGHALGPPDPLLLFSHPTPD